MLTSRGLGRVLGDLAEMGFDAEWCVLGADDVGAPHRRKRIWILASHPDRLGCEREWIGGILDGEREALGNDADGCGGAVSDADEIGRDWRPGMQREGRRGEFADGSRGPTEPDLGGVADGLAERMDGFWASEPADVPRVARGVPHRVDRLKAIGNGQVPLTAALAWRVLSERIGR
jgi:DNA (cytosine-5)-methyltransferase 1